MNYKDLESLYDKFGGKFRFSVLLQKRVRMLVEGDRPLVRPKGTNPVDIAVSEAQAGKIWLEEGSDKVMTGTADADAHVDSASPEAPEPAAQA